MSPIRTAAGAAFWASAPGVYDVEGDLFKIFLSPDGKALVATGPSDNPVSTGYVLAKGRKLSEPEEAPPTG